MSIQEQITRGNRLITVNAVLETGFAGCNHEETIEIEVPNWLSLDAQNEYVEKEVREWALNKIGFSWEYNNKTQEEQ